MNTSANKRYKSAQHLIQMEDIVHPYNFLNCFKNILSADCKLLNAVFLFLLV